MLLLAAAAAGTSRIRLGTTSWLLTLRHPLLAAEQVAVMDQLCEGRLVLGIGRGFDPTMLAAFDVPSREKRAILERAVVTMKRAWAGTRMPVGEETIVVAPQPVQRPHPPLWMAAFGPLALAQAGRLGLPYLASPLESPDELRINREHVLRGAAAAGVVPDSAFPVMRTVLVLEDDHTAAPLQARVIDALRSSGRVRDDASLADRVIIGTRSAVADKLLALAADCGVTHVIASRPRGVDLPAAMVEASFERLAGIGADQRPAAD